MKISEENRACKRQSYTATIEVAHFNKEPYYEAQTINHSEGGMCFKSSFPSKPGNIIYIRVKNFHPNGHSCTGRCKGLHYVSLAEIKWCGEALDAGSDLYQIGVKYLEPDY